jgi:hypothetical protein
MINKKSALTIPQRLKLKKKRLKSNLDLEVINDKNGLLWIYFTPTAIAKTPTKNGNNKVVKKVFNPTLLIN